MVDSLVVNFEEKRKETCKKILRKTLKMRPIDTVLVITDNNHRDFYEVFAETAREFECNPSFYVLPDSSRPVKALPNALRQSLLASDVVVTAIDHYHEETSLRNALHNAARKRNAKILHMVGVPTEALHASSTEVNYAEISERTSKLFNYLIETKEIEVTSKNGTKLSFTPGSVREVDAASEAAPGKITFFPGGEVYLQPDLFSLNGKLVVDGTVTGLGQLKKPLTLKIEKGEVVSVQGQDKKFLEDLLAKDASARKVSEFGLGTNHGLELSEHTYLSEKVMGTCHFGLGNSAYFGGNVISTNHVALLVKQPSVKFDGKDVINEGNFLLG